jgi:hypothetical protein
MHSITKFEEGQGPPRVVEPMMITKFALQQAPYFIFILNYSNGKSGLE